MNRTRWIIVAIIIITLSIDIWLAVSGGSPATISVTLTNWAKERPVIPFAFGFLMGHLFAQDKI